MQQRSSPAVPSSLPPKRPPEGFVLLHTLVLLLIGATLAAIILERSLGRARDVRTELTVGRLELAAEGGVQQALQHMLSQKGRGNVGAPNQFVIDDIVVHVSTQFSDGLVGLRNRNKEYIESVSVAALGGRGARVAATLLSPAVETVSSYAGLARLSGLSAADLDCLLGYVSLYVDNGSPVLAHAPAELRGLLRSRNPPPPSAIQGDSISSAGAVIRIRARARREGTSSRELFVEVLATGRLDTPVKVLEWMWLPVSAQGADASGRCASPPH